jgi:hypothetical protein
MKREVGKGDDKVEEKKGSQRCGERQMKDAKSETLATGPLLSHVVISSFSNPSKGACRYSCEVIWGVHHHSLHFLDLSNDSVLISIECLLCSQISHRIRCSLFRA